jgi:hypothetical protein
MASKAQGVTATGVFMTLGRRAAFILGIWFLVTATTVQATPRLSVVELYTSEGCSSCPPADAYLGELARREGILALSFHVDYWNDLGWRDASALSSLTSRQQAYARRLRLNSIFTPQIIVDGRESFVGTDRRGIEAFLARSSPKHPITLSVENGEVVIAVAPSETSEGDEVVLVPFRQRIVTQVVRGENHGRTLEEFNVVRELRTVGRTSTQSQQWHIRFDALPKDATDVAVLLQRPQQGEIVGVARVSLAPGRGAS